MGYSGLGETMDCFVGMVVVVVVVSKKAEQRQGDEVREMRAKSSRYPARARARSYRADEVVISDHQARYFDRAVWSKSMQVQRKEAGGEYPGCLDHAGGRRQ